MTETKAELKAKEKKKYMKIKHSKNTHGLSKSIGTPGENQCKVGVWKINRN